MAYKAQFPSMIRVFVCSTYLSPLPTVDWGGAHELHSLWQPFWPVMSTVEDTLNLTRLQELIKTISQFMICVSANSKVIMLIVVCHIHKYVFMVILLYVYLFQLPEHRSLLEQLHWYKTARPCPVCTQWISPARGGQLEPGGSSDLSPVCLPKAALADRRSAGSTHSYIWKYNRYTVVGNVVRIFRLISIDWSGVTHFLPKSFQ